LPFRSRKKTAEAILTVREVNFVEVGIESGGSREDYSQISLVSSSRYGLHCSGVEVLAALIDKLI
jgi:hypothetical protein